MTTANARVINPSSKQLPANAANDHMTGRDYINRMRAMLGKSSVASRFDKLTEQQKATVLYGAKLRPSSLITTPFDAMKDDEREAIRQSLIALTDLANNFAGLSMGKADVIPAKSKPRQIHPLPQRRAENFDQLTRFAAELVEMAKEVKTQ